MFILSNISSYIQITTYLRNWEFEAYPTSTSEQQRFSVISKPLVRAISRSFNASLFCRPELNQTEQK